MNEPKLRFPGFNEKWQKINLKDVFKYYNNNSLSRDKLSNTGSIKNIHYGDIHKKYNTLTNVEKDVNTFIKDLNYKNKQELCNNFDIIFADASEDYDEIGKAIELTNIDCDTVSGLHTILARDNKNIFAPKFKGYYFNSPVIHNQIRILANGFKVYGITKDTINQLLVNIPSIQEQTKIVNMFELLDKRIELQSKKIEGLKLFKKGLIISIMNNIVGNKVPLKNIMTEINDKTNINNQYEIISSTSNGIFLQKDYFNKQAASENNVGYKIIRKNQLVLSPQNLWMGNININDKYDIGMVSPSYKIYDISLNIDIEYLKCWIKLPHTIYEFKLASEQGASVVRRNLNLEQFYEILINVPNKNLQRKIGRMSKKIDDKIEKEIEELNELNKFKKGLMQKMFV